MIRYSIKELEHLSGIKAHTLRIWEQRYGIIQPQRTPTNIRYYNKQDLKMILKIALLNRNGHKISKIACMCEQELKSNFQLLMEDTSQNDFQISALTTAMVDMDEEKFEEIMMKNIQHQGFEKTMVEIIYPFLEKIGILWLSGSINPAQEHFMSNLIRQKIIVGIDQISSRLQEQRAHCLLFLPENELHELGLLFAHYLLKKRGYQVTYLGANVPQKDVIEVSKIKNIDMLFSIMTSAPTNKKLNKFLTKLGTELPNCKIYISGYQATRINFPIADNIKVIYKVTDLIELEATPPAPYNNYSTN